MGELSAHPEKRVMSSTQHKYYSRCRKSTHNTKDCWFDKGFTEKSRKPQENKNSKTYVIQPSRITPKELVVNTIINNKVTVDAVLDSGNGFNYIYLEMLQETDAVLEPITPTYVTFGNGKKRTVDKKIEINIKLPEFAGNSQITTYLLQGLPTNMILGLGFFKLSECKIDFKTYNITINNTKK